MNLFRRLMGPVGEADGGGAAVVDRGDNLDAAAVDAAAAAAATADVTAQAEMDAKAIADAAAASEQARDPETGKFIPKARFDEQVGAERSAREAAERRTQELEIQLGQMTRGIDIEAAEAAIVALEQQHTKLLLDGKHEEAATVMKDIRLKERQIALSEANQMANQTRAIATEEIRVEMVVERLESTYDVMNPAKDVYNQDVVDLVLAKQGQLISVDKMAPAAALTKAAADVMKLITPSSAAAAKPGLGAAASADRAAAQLARNLATDKSQPSDLKAVGLDTDQAGMKGQVDVNKLSYEEFEALPEATKSKLRGDFA